MKGLVVAVQFLTRLPTPRINVTNAEFAASMRWFPAVGAIVGLVVAFATALGGLIDAWTGAFLGVAAWIVVTGGLHLDGLADCIDAAGAAHKISGETADDRKVRLRAILADPHIGSFGAIAIALQVVAKLVLLHALVAEAAQRAMPGEKAALLALPIAVAAAARIGPLVWNLRLPSLHDGLGARFRHAAGWGHVAFWALAVLACALLVNPAQGMGLALAPLPVLGWSHWLRTRLGGISGDGHGGGIEFCETVLLLAGLAAAVIPA
ncbi:adenosylcobinamide-GDP ribazoletransferase [Novosphingobium sp. 1949]|uniref:Adenosylcobinamide-GDP ribazoletransferase n=1 Tax=Novosphingobium organovorum TaxID=2930092 RepID=A0ABT0BG10_9SPHN|nr:adenosylcobinamide-GDP ribazoletransferase [Novosphingobium organovorum]MCJ2183973.1 adenosylcobinamide-GDP ribazoletransferase [Novosphingobium organovorum]